MHQTTTLTIRLPIKHLEALESLIQPGQSRNSVAAQAVARFVYEQKAKAA